MTTTTSAAVNQLRNALAMMYGITTLHHVYGGLADSISARLLVPVYAAVPLVAVWFLLGRYKRSRNTLMLAIALGLVVVVFVVGLGVVHGGYSHLYKDVLYLLNGSPDRYNRLNADKHYPPDDLFFEVTGLAEVIVAIFVTLSSFRLVRHSQTGRIRPGAH